MPAVLTRLHHGIPYHKFTEGSAHLRSLEVNLQLQGETAFESKMETSLNPLETAVCHTHQVEDASKMECMYLC